MDGGALRTVPEREGNESGQALVEYTLILALVTLVALGSLTAVGANTTALLDVVQAAIASIPLP
jgi:Flp pilus assembly pilin Flp